MSKPAWSRSRRVVGRKFRSRNPRLRRWLKQPAIPIPRPTIASRVLRVPLNKIRPSALQPRKQFSEESLRELLTRSANKELSSRSLFASAENFLN